jgi:SulP family sulfate permease
MGELKDVKILRADILAGMTVSLILIPQSMANAQLASLPPYYGLYAALLPTIIAAMFGSCRQLSTGSVALVSLMTAAALQPVVAFDHPDYIAYTILLAFMVGVMQLAFALFRLGSLINFLSQPVVLGFTNAGAIIIGTSQIDLIFGVHVNPGGPHYMRVWQTLEQAVLHTHWPTLVMATLAFAIMGGFRKFAPRVPGILLAVVATTLISWSIGFGSALGGAVIGTIPRGIPEFSIPKFDFEVMRRLLSPAMTIALIGYVGTISIAKTLATQTRQRISANRELLGQGLSNIVGSFFLSHPVSGSFARSAVNLRAGAQTGFSSVVAVGIVVAILMWFTPLLYHLPAATLAAIIMMSVFGLVKLKPIVRMWRVHRHDGWVAVVAFALTLLAAPHLDVGIVIGAGLSLVLYLYRTMTPRVAVLSRHPDGALRDADTNNLEMCEVMSMLRFDGSLYFGSAGAFEDMMLERVAQNPHLRYVIVDAEGINQLDATGEEMLVGVVQRLQEAEVAVLFAGTKKQIMDALTRTGSLAQMGRERFFATPDQAIQSVWAKLDGEFPCHHLCPGECPLHRAKPKGAVFYRV